MEHRLATHEDQLDRAAIADGEADGLVGCWLCGRYFKPHLLLDGLLCPDCAEDVNALPVAQLCRQFDEELERHAETTSSIREAMRRAANAIMQSRNSENNRTKITVKDIWGE